ncbi:MAG: hypothetical protein SPI06_03370 [Terrisporobacter sp.]|uniref:hypothetical protein n=1 Tax=Terrisporobacter sp. TaxID=1965305 RepID=UPI002A90D2C3|nr:hypothetical protein [Terrisporobacter sp.]MDY6152429.1 hypothetical protein [Terrisporobacter sp.]
MCTLLMGMLFRNEVISSKLGTPINVVELFHTTTINSLNNIRLTLSNKIKQLESQDEWIASEINAQQLNIAKLNIAKRQKELVNLVIGYKRYKMEVEENIKKKAELTAKLKELKDSQKSPEDKIKELEAELSAIDETETF